MVRAEATAGNLPINDLGNGLYLGQFEGGLYPGSLNSMPAAHAAEGLARANAIQPLDAGGRPDPNGRIVFLSIGMSNAMFEFCGEPRLENPCTPNAFTTRAARDPAVDKNNLYLVNGAKGGQVSILWDQPFDENYEEIQQQMLAPQELTEAQVQVIWLKIANFNTENSLPDPRADAYQTVRHYGNILRTLKIRYPNLQQVFISSRIYAGYSQISHRREPIAYEYGFATKWVIEAQIYQMASGEIDALAGDLDFGTVAPWIAWGPYLWADGLNPRSDGLIWERSDFIEDGVHPTETGGVAKVGEMMMDFFINDPATEPWFVGAVKTPGSIAGAVQLQGRSDHSGALVKALLWNATVVSTTTDVDGNYFLPVPPALAYRVTVEMPGYLTAAQDQIKIGEREMAGLGLVTLPGGDGNGDGLVDILDLSLIGANFNSTCADPLWTPAADINADCTVNIFDLAIAGSNYGLAGPFSWP